MILAAGVCVTLPGVHGVAGAIEALGEHGLAKGEIGHTGKTAKLDNAVWTRRARAKGTRPHQALWMPRLVKQGLERRVGECGKRVVRTLSCVPSRWRGAVERQPQ